MMKGCKIRTEIINQILHITSAQSHMKCSYILIIFLLVAYKATEQCNLYSVHLG